MAVNVQTVNTIRRGCGAVRDLVDVARVRGPLCDVSRKRVAQVSRTAKWLQRALGNMIADDPQLKSLLPEFAIAPEPTDEELDALCEQRAKEREASR